VDHLPVLFAIFPAYVATFTLEAVEVVHRLDCREDIMSVAGKHHHKNGVPLEDVPAEGFVQPVGDQRRTFWRLFEALKGDLPALPIHINPFGITLENGGRQPIPIFRKYRQWFGNVLLFVKIFASRLVKYLDGRPPALHHAYFSSWLR
jgi:hypothetical protein